MLKWPQRKRFIAQEAKTRAAEVTAPTLAAGVRLANALKGVLAKAHESIAERVA